MAANSLFFFLPGHSPVPPGLGAAPYNMIIPDSYSAIILWDS